MFATVGDGVKNPADEGGIETPRLRPGAILGGEVSLLTATLVRSARSDAATVEHTDIESLGHVLGSNRLQNFAHGAARPVNIVIRECPGQPLPNLLISDPNSAMVPA